MKFPGKTFKVTQLYIKGLGVEKESTSLLILATCRECRSFESVVPMALPFVFSYSSLYLILREKRKSTVSERETLPSKGLGLTSARRTILRKHLPVFRGSRRRLKYDDVYNVNSHYFFQQDH